MPQRRLPPSLVGLGLVALAAGVGGVASAAAAPITARYEVRAAGLVVMRVEAVFDLDAPGGLYRVGTRIRTTGVVGLLSRSDQVTSVEGRWLDLQPQPLHYRVEGSWRGAARRVAIAWTAGGGGMPVVGALVPPNDSEREAVPPALQRGTMDALSALAKLTRAVALTGRCDADAQTFDGRRRADYVVRTAGVDMLPADEGYAGQALRCAFESRLIAGRRADQDPEEARRPVPATAWMAQVAPAPIPVPVRVDLPSGWFGTIRVHLVGLELGGAFPGGSDQLVQQRR